MRADERGISRRGILAAYPSEGVTEGGIAAMLKRTKDAGHAAPGARMRRRQIRANATGSLTQQMIDGDCGLSLGKIAGELDMKKRQCAK